MSSIMASPTARDKQFRGLKRSKRRPLVRRFRRTFADSGLVFVRCALLAPFDVWLTCYNRALQLNSLNRTTKHMVKTIKIGNVGTKKVSVPMGSEAKHFGAGATSFVVNDGLTVHWNQNGKALGQAENLHAQNSFGQYLPKGVRFYGDVIAVIDDAASKPQASAKKKGD